MPNGGVLLRDTVVLFFTNSVDDLGEIGTACLMMLCKRVSCLNVYSPCCSDTLQAPKMCVVVQTFSLHKVHTASVVILHLLRLLGNSRMSTVDKTK